MVNLKPLMKLHEIPERLAEASTLEEGLQILREAESLLSRPSQFRFYFLENAKNYWFPSNFNRKGKYYLSINDYVEPQAVSFWRQRLKDVRYLRLNNSELRQDDFLKHYTLKGVRELLVLPVIENKILSWCIEIRNFHAEYFTNQDIEISKSLASLFSLYWNKLKNYADEEIRGDQIKKLFEVIKELELTELLKQVVFEIPDILKGKGCSIFLLPDFFPEGVIISKAVLQDIKGKEEKVVVLAATKGLKTDQIGEAYYDFGEGITGWVAMQGLPININDISNAAELEKVAKRECERVGVEYREISWAQKYNEFDLTGEISRPFLVTPIKAPKTSKVIGVLRLVALEGTENWSNNDVTILSGFADLLGVKIERDFITGAILRIFQERDKNILLKEIAKRAYRLVGGSGCSIFLQDEMNYDKIIVAASTVPEEERGLRFYERGGKGCTAWVFTTGQPLILEDIQNEKELKQTGSELTWGGATVPGYCCETENPGPFLGVPIKVGEEVIGVIRIPREANSNPFTEQDLEILKTLAGQVSLVFEHQIKLSEKHQLKQQERKRLINLYELGSKMQEQFNLDRLCHFVLTGITHGDVIGINRAMLLKYSSELRQLRGIMALGPSNFDEAIEYKNMVEKIYLPLEKCISEFDRQGGPLTTKLQSYIYNITLDLDEECKCLALIENYKEEITELELHSVSKSLAEFFKVIEADRVTIITLPITPDQVFIILCDYIYTHRDLDHNTKELLKLFIKQALRAFQRLYQDEEIRKVKEGVWHELSAIAAHRLGQLLPIVNNRLEEMLANAKDDSELDILQKTPDLREIQDLVVQAMKTVSAFKQQFVTEVKVESDRPLSINIILKEFQNYLKQNHADVEVKIELMDSHELPVLVLDLISLKECIDILLANSLDLKPKGLRILLKAYLTTAVEVTKFALIQERSFVTFYYQDNGPGVQYELKQKIFDPFFTTKRTGSGVGLTIVKQIINAHFGKIVEDGIVGEGAIFKIFLPIYNKEV